MTAQMPDTVEFLAENFALAAKSGSGLFDPIANGLNPVGSCSACWRGYICSYFVKHDELRLGRTQVSLGRDDLLKFKYGRLSYTLFGVTARQAQKPFFHVEFNELDHHLPYTGGLLLCRDFIREMYVHMGFHPAWKYRTVYELKFDHGKLIQSNNRSQEIAEFRSEIADLPLKPGDEATRNEIKSWIARCFSQDYRW